MTNTAGLHPTDNPEDVETWKYVDLVVKRPIVRFRATLFSFERPRSSRGRPFQLVEHALHAHLEICIVIVSKVMCSSVKILRAHGGCLGTRSR